MPDEPRQSRRVLYGGRVQGVGFRFTVLQIAKGRAVTGFVRNLADGRVELVAEGSAAELDRFLAEIAAAMAGNIHQTEVAVGVAAGRFTDFRVER